MSARQSEMPTALPSDLRKIIIQYLPNSQALGYLINFFLAKIKFNPDHEWIGEINRMLAHRGQISTFDEGPVKQVYYQSYDKVVEDDFLLDLLQTLETDGFIEEGKYGNIYYTDASQINGRLQDMHCRVCLLIRLSESYKSGTPGRVPFTNGYVIIPIKWDWQSYYD